MQYPGEYDELLANEFWGWLNGLLWLIKDYTRRERYAEAENYPVTPRFDEEQNRNENSDILEMQSREIS